MATLAFEDTGADRAAKPPISTHPAFPAIVALWFAALFGLGSLVLPPVLLERLVEATGLASLIPSLAPPLGFTARGLLAIGAAVAGTLLGLVIARRVAAAHADVPESRISKLAGGLRGPRPISVREEIGGEGVVNGEGLPVNRRRALAIAEDDRPSDFLYRAPLPGDDPFSPAPPVDEMPAPAEEEPLELSDALEEPAEPYDYPAEEPTDEDDDMTDRQEFQPISPFESCDEPAPEPSAQEDVLDLRKNAAGPRGLEPLPFAAPSLARRAPTPVAEVEPEPEAEPQLEPQSEPAAFAMPPAPEPEPVRGDWATAPLEGLGLVQLVQRLGSTIERRREWVATGRLAAPAPAVPTSFEAAPAEEAAQAMAAFFGAPPATLPEPEASEPAPEADEDEDEFEPRPAFLRGVADGEDDDEDALPDFSLPLRKPGAATPFAQFDQDEDGTELPVEDEEEEAADDSYSSLLAMRNPFAANPASEFVRIEEPEPELDTAEPAVVFPSRPIADVRIETGREATARLFDPPGKAPAAQPARQRAASPDADAALRAALATLQRMSGGAA